MLRMDAYKKASLAKKRRQTLRVYSVDGRASSMTGAASFPGPQNDSPAHRAAGVPSWLALHCTVNMTRTSPYKTNNQVANAVPMSNAVAVPTWSDIGRVTHEANKQASSLCNVR